MSSIRWRMTGWLVLAGSVLWACGGIALYLMVRAGLVAQFDQALEATSQTIVPMSEYTGGRIEFDSGAT